MDEFDGARTGATPHTALNVASSRSNDDIGIARTTFTWTASAGTQTPGASAFALRIDDPLLFQRGRINLVVGPTGAGKTSLLMALLGEMHATQAGPDAFVRLPRAGGVAYAAQESWVQNESIRVGRRRCSAACGRSARG